MSPASALPGSGDDVGTVGDVGRDLGWCFAPERGGELRGPADHVTEHAAHGEVRARGRRVEIVRA